MPPDGHGVDDLEARPSQQNQLSRLPPTEHSRSRPHGLALGGFRYQKCSPHTKLNRRVCEDCHLNDQSKWPQISKTAGHELHVKRANLECLSCHLPSLHAVKPTTKECVTCHSKATANIGGMKAFHCTTCHQFAAKDVGHGLKPEKETCVACHSGMSLKGETFPDHGPMQFDCSACHKPHTRPLLSFSDCLACHPQITEDRRHFDQKALTRCVSCHKPHSWKAVTESMAKKS